MNEEKVKDMKAQYAIRQSENLLPAKLTLQSVELPHRESRTRKIQSALGAIWGRLSQPGNDLDLEAWRRIECRNDYEPPRESRQINIQRRL